MCCGLQATITSQIHIYYATASSLLEATKISGGCQLQSYSVTIVAMAVSAKEGFSEMLKIVCSMLSRNECMVFREPVDWKGLGLLDYPEIVQRPMDLGTIKKRIENDDYNVVEDIASDVRLVWSNCMLYNRDGSEVSLTFAFFTKFASPYSSV
jgi:Bromodomain